MPPISRPALRATLAAALVILAGCNDGGTSPADVVLRGGKVVTMDDQRTVAQAVAVKDGRITFVGSDADVTTRIGRNTKVIELEGRMLMPGFIDAHLHSIAGGRALLVCDLQYQPLTRAQLVERLQACLDASTDRGADAWLEAVNWDRQATANLDTDPTAQTLTALTTTRPVVVTSSDFHSVLANARALQLAGITAATPDPAGGSFLRDAQGNPTGIGIDGGGFQIKAAIPPDTQEDVLNQARAALQAIRAQGITSFMDAAAGENTLRTFQTLQKNSELTARVNLALSIQLADDIPALRAVADAGDKGDAVAQPGVRARILKLFMDGVVNAPADNGALLQPYFQNAGTPQAPVLIPSTNYGALYFEQARLQDIMVKAMDNGFDIHMHATGDRGVRTALNALQNARQQRPQADFRPAIAHAETVAVSDYARFAAEDVMATMSFQWGVRASFSVGLTEQHLGPDRFARMEPSGSLRQAGARIVHGSDWPIDAFDTFLALKAGVTRSGDPQNPRSPASQSPDYVGRINDDPALSRDDVLAAITRNAAYQLRLDKQVGTLEAGKLADMVILEADFLTVPDEELARNRALLTMVGGQTVYATGPYESQMSTATATRTADARAMILSPKGSAGMLVHQVGKRVHICTPGDGHLPFGAAAQRVGATSSHQPLRVSSRACPRGPASAAESCRTLA